ncbi:MAG: SMP-30/gluconolactonase/LRE family protein [Chloroflexota bacterium]|nr:SMP-30/gluconolactonase/LRE family protein [Chloroflexota bacterium]
MPNPRVFARGFNFPEAPAFDRQGNLYVGNMRVNPGVIHVVTPDGKVSEWTRTSGYVNGMAFDKEGNIFACDAGLRAILKITPKKEVSCVCPSYRGRPLGGPNDLVFDSQGNLYFTDPVRRPILLSLIRPTPDLALSPVFVLDPRGRPTLVADSLAFPNGIGLMPDEKTLIVAASRRDQLLAIAIKRDGTFGEPKLFHQFAEGWHPDSLKVDAEGNVLAAMLGHGCIAVVSPAGKLVEEIPAGGKRPSNLAFGHPNNKLLYITETETNSVTLVEYSRPGLAPYGLS